MVRLVRPVAGACRSRCARGLSTTQRADDPQLDTAIVRSLQVRPAGFGRSIACLDPYQAIFVIRPT
jgi:hypothetical protein